MTDQTPIISTHRGKTVVLGRKRVSPHVLGIARVAGIRVLEAFPTAGETADYIAAARAQCNGQYGMGLNDKLGCCTITDGPYHTEQIWTANNGTMKTAPDSVILKAYETVDGYDPKDPSTDQGGIEAQVIAAWKVGIDGFSKLDLFIEVDPRNLEHNLTGIERYGAVYRGVALPLDAQDQAVWQLDESNPAAAMPGSWGGHAISYYKYNRTTRMYETITWGMEQGASFDWDAAYCDEARIPFCSTLWCPNGKSPMGDLVATLTGGITSLGGA